MKPRYFEYEMENGEFVTMTINMSLMYQLKATNKKAYQGVSGKLISGAKEITDVPEILYGAYACANQGTQIMPYQTFLEEMNQSLEYNTNAVRELVKPKKHEDSETPS